MRKLFILATASAFAAVVALPEAAMAHTFGAYGAGFANGFGHPFGGLDHLLAMIAVGLWAAQMGGRALWLLPAAFLAVMATAGTLAAGGLGLPGVEFGVAGSVALLGLLIASNRRLPPWLGAALAGGFAVFHGIAHGAEMPQAAAPLLYGLGFLAATAGLQLAGLGIGLLARAGGRRRLLRGAGVMASLAGLAILAAI